MEDWSSGCSVARGRTRDATAVTGVQEGCGGWENVMAEQGPQGGRQQPEAYADSGPKHTTHHTIMWF